MTLRDLSERVESLHRNIDALQKTVEGSANDRNFDHVNLESVYYRFRQWGLKSEHLSETFRDYADKIEEGASLYGIDFDT